MRQYIVIALVLAGYGAYSLPWAVSPAASLSMGANDLAEWASLHPTVTPPLLLTSLLLRLPMLSLVSMLSFSLPHSKTALVVAMLLILTMLPPLEIVTSARDNANYRQQIVLTVLATGITFVGFLGVLRRWQHYVVLLAGAVGVAASVLGFYAAEGLLQDLNLTMHVGAGVICMALICVVISIYNRVGSRPTLREISSSVS